MDFTLQKSTLDLSVKTVAGNWYCRSLMMGLYYSHNKNQCFGTKNHYFGIKTRQIGIKTNKTLSESE